MRTFGRVVAICIASAFVASSTLAQVAPQTESDAYTRYELLAPGTAKFRIIYEVTANTPGMEVS